MCSKRIDTRQFIKMWTQQSVPKRSADIKAVHRSCTTMLVCGIRNCVITIHWPMAINYWEAVNGQVRFGGHKNHVTRFQFGVTRIGCAHCTMRLSLFVLLPLAPAVLSQTTNETLWGAYRPNLYFGLRPRIPKSLMTGFMWFGTQDYESAASVFSINHFISFSN